MREGINTMLGAAQLLARAVSITPGSNSTSPNLVCTTVSGYESISPVPTSTVPDIPTVSLATRVCQTLEPIE
jgi:hypothetical protein